MQINQQLQLRGGSMKFLIVSAIIMACSSLALAAQGGKNNNRSVVELTVIKCGPSSTGSGCGAAPTTTDPLNSGMVEIGLNGEVKIVLKGAAPGMTYRVFISDLVLSHATSISQISKTVLTNDPNRFVSWDVTSDVQAFVQGIAPNNGWLVKDEKEDDPELFTTHWVSKENVSNVCGADSAPRLIVDTGAGSFIVGPPQADAYLDQNSPNENKGALESLLVRSWENGSNYRTLVKFDLSNIASAETISGARLEICLDRISGNQSTRVYGVYRLTTPWIEDEVTASIASSGRLWNSYFGDFGAQFQFIGNSMVNSIGTVTTDSLGNYTGAPRTDAGTSFFLPSATKLIGVPSFVFNHANGGPAQFVTGVEIR
jgi:hypothetical protein